MLEQIIVGIIVGTVLLIVTMVMVPRAKEKGANDKKMLEKASEAAERLDKHVNEGPRNQSKEPKEIDIICQMARSLKTKKYKDLDFLKKFCEKYKAIKKVPMGGARSDIAKKLKDYKKDVMILSKDLSIVLVSPANINKDTEKISDEYEPAENMSRFLDLNMNPHITTGTSVQPFFEFHNGSKESIIFEKIFMTFYHKDEPGENHQEEINVFRPVSAGGSLGWEFLRFDYKQFPEFSNIETLPKKAFYEYNFLYTDEQGESNKWRDKPKKVEI